MWLQMLPTIRTIASILLDAAPVLASPFSVTWRTGFGRHQVQKLYYGSLDLRVPERLPLRDRSPKFSPNSSSWPPLSFSSNQQKGETTRSYSSLHWLISYASPLLRSGRTLQIWLRKIPWFSTSLWNHSSDASLSTPYLKHSPDKNIARKAHLLDSLLSMDWTSA